MRQIALHEAKDKLSELIRELETTGEEVVITRHGKPVARLARARPKLGSDERRRLFDELTELRDTRTDAGMTPFDWKAAVEDGRE